jgi:hypothetical protein
MLFVVQYPKTRRITLKFAADKDNVEASHHSKKQGETEKPNE